MSESIATTLEYEVDPVCGAEVETSGSVEHGLAIEYEDRQYVFCSPACQARFVRDPGRFASTGSSSVGAGGRSGGSV